MFSSPTNTYSVSLKLFVLEIIFMRLAKNFRKGRWTTTPLGTSFKVNQEGQQGPQDPTLNIGHPIMRTSLHLVLVRGMMGMQMHPLSLVLTWIGRAHV